MANDVCYKAVSGNLLREHTACALMQGGTVLSQPLQGFYATADFSIPMLVIAARGGQNRLYYTTGAADPNAPATP